MANLRRVREKGVYGRVGRVRRGEHGADSRAGEGGRAVGTGTRDCGDEGRRGERAEETASDSHRGRGLRTALSTLPALMARCGIYGRRTRRLRVRRRPRSRRQCRQWGKGGELTDREGWAGENSGKSIPKVLMAREGVIRCPGGSSYYGFRKSRHIMLPFLPSVSIWTHVRRIAPRFYGETYQDNRLQWAH